MKPVIYEVRLRIDKEAQAAFDAWLRTHVDDMLQFDGFESVQLIEPESADADQAVRITRYRVASRAQLRDYLELHAQRMRAEGEHRFAGQLSTTRDIYLADTDNATAARHHCQNCNAPLTGQYCTECGQRDKHRIISLWELLRDVVGDVFDLDSRMWRTVFPLLARPGHLTLEYLRGRRVHYSPPFRMYLITSLLFFLVAFFGDPISGIEVNGDPEEAGEALNEALREAGVDPAAADSVVAEVMRETGAEPAPGAGNADATEGGGDADDSTRCDNISIGEAPWQKALEKRVTMACERLSEEGGLRRFGASLVDNLPGMMFVFLPLIALVMKLLYPLSRRYYVEHLLFFVHFHSFFFLALTLSLLVGRVPATVPGQGVVSGLMSLGLFFYTPIYLFRAMRRVYGQSVLVTWIKFGALFAAYLVSLGLMFLLVVAFTALSL